MVRNIKYSFSNLFILFCFLSLALGSRANEPARELDSKNTWYTGFSAGVQMSGIKSEDFVARNYSPMLTIYAGKWFTPLLALQLGYRGNYFNTISHDRRRYYKYFSGEAVFNLNQLISPKSNEQKLNALLHAGSGYFYNHDYDRPNICAHLGASASYRLTHKLNATFNTSFIMGWDIYQGNEDILPGLSLGISYTL